MERTIQQVQPMKLAERKVLRVAAYARVSCDKDEMRRSLQAQVDYYKKLIHSNSDWRFAGVYADAFYTGTKDNRPQFVEMLKACKDDRIDRIITKSISRFARNTVTLLSTVRDLRRAGIGIYFEAENIDTLTEAGELMITLLASKAQEESRATSENCKWRIKKMFEEGYTTPFNMLGYKAVDGLVETIPVETEIVQRIFQLYLEGYGKQAIANMLKEERVPSCLGGEWAPTTIGSILKNEKYAGDLLLQKSFVEDHISKISRKNHGEMPKYFIQDDHEAIISREMFNAVEEESARRRAKYGHASGEKSELSSKVCCGICGKNYRRKTTPARILWCCSTYNMRGKKYCASKAIPEMTLKEACCQALGLVEYEPQAVADRIVQIDAMPENRLIFHIADGADQEIQWTFPSRSESWTEGKRQKVAEQVRRHHAKTSR